MTEVQEETTLRDDIENAMTEIAEAEIGIAKEPVEETPQAEAKPRAEDGKFKAKEVAAETVQPVIAPTPKVEAPASLSAKMKAKWETLDPETQAEIRSREEEVHKGFTKLDEDRNLGKTMKDVITPYMQIITAEGGTPEKAVRDLLNTAYILRTAQPLQKAQLVQQVIQQYGVDMNLLGQQQQHPADPNAQLYQLQQEIAQLRQQANPDAIRKQLQEQQEEATMQAEVRAFASDPANVHFEKVKPAMAVLLGNGLAKNMKEAYEAACYADPVIRSTLETSKKVEEQAKRTAEVAAKQKAAVSVTGSPGAIIPNSGHPERTLREELQANLRAAISS